MESYIWVGSVSSNKTNLILTEKNKKHTDMRNSHLFIYFQEHYIKPDRPIPFLTYISVCIYFISAYKSILNYNSIISYKYINTYA